MGQRVPRTRASGKWTEARYWAFIRGLLRAGFQKWPAKHTAKLRARRSVEGQSHTYEYICANCLFWFKDKEVQVDHIVGAGSLKCYADIPGFTERLFCETEGLQVLCKPCHQEKTNEERKQRNV
jgi:5-methylcytosine-specific restriction endonuclease McrA